MNHDVLGRITRKKNSSSGTAKIRFGDRDIEVLIDADDASFDDAVSFAAEVVTSLNRLDRAAKNIATDELQPTYNEGWNTYDESLGDGTFKEVILPKLTKAAFQKKLSLKTISIMGKSCVEFYYDDENMFWGHELMVTSFEGTDFSDASADIVG